MGDPILPDDLNSNFEVNSEILLNTLNTPNAFDKILKLEKGDRLEVVICIYSKHNNYILQL